MEIVICESCRERRHEKCRGGSWCDCQHRDGPATRETTTSGPRDEPGPDSGDGAGKGEPAVNWRRQG
ncbi:hypothetical protein GCM10010182_29030 [Actinomadura cremea]|nr:hypothetical protein GCM10010182_29030 [Actinomadura cremea]